MVCSVTPLGPVVDNIYITREQRAPSTYNIEYLLFGVAIGVHGSCVSLFLFRFDRTDFDSDAAATHRFSPNGWIECNFPFQLSTFANRFSHFFHFIFHLHARSYKDQKPAVSSEESIPITSSSSDEIQRNAYGADKRRAETNYDAISNEIHGINGRDGETNSSHEKPMTFVPKIDTSALDIENDSNDDDDDLSDGENDSATHRPQSKASTNTTKSLRDEESEDVVDAAARPQSVASVAVDGEPAPEPDSDGEEITEKQGLPSKAGVVGDADAGEERTVEIHVQNAPDEILVQNEFAPDEKGSDLGESKTDSDSRSLTSNEESSDYPPPPIATIPIKAFEEPLPVPIIEHIDAIKPISKFRPPALLRRNKVAAATVVKSSPSTAQHHASQATKSSQLFASNLRRFEKPREASVSCLAQMDNANWEITMNGLQTFVRLIRHHPEIVEANFHTYCVALAKQVRNLRSQVSRSACQASAEFFETHAKQMEQEPDDLAAQLLNRTADTNKFLRADAARALNAMCDNLPPPKVIQTLVTRGANHQNAIVRTASANLCCRIVSRLGGDKVFGLHRECRDKLILAGANFLMEGSLETRNNAKVLFKQLAAHPHYNRILLDVIPPRIYRNIEKALRSIK